MDSLKVLEVVTSRDFLKGLSIAVEGGDENAFCVVETTYFEKASGFIFGTRDLNKYSEFFSTQERPNIIEMKQVCRHPKIGDKWIPFGVGYECDEGKYLIDGFETIYPK